MAISPHRSWRRRRGTTAGLLAAALLLFLAASFMSRVRLHQQQQSSVHRRLGEDAALSAALNGLPVAPSARGPTVAGVNVYGLDPNLLAALQGSAQANASGSAAPATSQAPAPAPHLALTSSTGQAASSPDQGATRAPRPPAQYAPLDPYLAAALEGHAPAPAAGLPGAAPSAGTTMPASPPAMLIAAGTPWAAEQEQLAAVCDEPVLQAATLKLLQERPFASLFPTLGNVTEFDPTGMEYVNHVYYLVFNRSQTVAYIPDRLLPLDEKNKLISLSSALEGPNFAGIAYRPDTGNFMAVQEHVPHNSTRWGTGPRPEIYNLALSGDLQTYAVQSHCWVAFNLSDAITGFQDIQYYTDPKGVQWLLGLCLGNHCATGELGQDRGNGRIVVSHMRINGTRCAWVPDRVLSVPGTAAFSAFTGLAIRGDQVLISSQVDSAVWLGGFNWTSWSFNDEGLLLHLPRDNACRTTYCSIGAVQWLDDQRISLATGVATPGDPWPCFSKSESLMQFQLPQLALQAMQKRVANG